MLVTCNNSGLTIRADSEAGIITGYNRLSCWTTLAVFTETELPGNERRGNKPAPVTTLVQRPFAGNVRSAWAMARCAPTTQRNCQGEYSSIAREPVLGIELVHEAE